MELSWWDIPGPSRYVRRVESDLRDRVNVVAALPVGFGTDWFCFFRHYWINAQEQIVILPLDGDSRSPLDILSSTFTTNPPGTTTLGALVSDSGFCGHVIGVFLDNRDDVKKWTAFLMMYERECRLMDQWGRTVFLVCTEGFEHSCLPTSETFLRVHSYDGYARPNDCYMYAWALLGGQEKHTWRTELRMALCAQLSQWDPRLCEVLAGRDIAGILRQSTSEGVLSSVCCDTVVEDQDVGWSKGLLQRIDGVVVWHSGWVVRNKMGNEFDRRIWTAQVQVMFPLIEQLRHQAIERFESQFRMPVLVGDNMRVDDPYDLEISMVRRIVSRLPGVPSVVLRRMEQAYTFRNALAHLQPLTAQELQNFEAVLE